eukprot:7493622-Pyramimonas_sp.AAC.1
MRPRTVACSHRAHLPPGQSGLSRLLPSSPLAQLLCPRARFGAVSAAGRNACHASPCRHGRTRPVH